MTDTPSAQERLAALAEKWFPILFHSGWDLSSECVSTHKMRELNADDAMGTCVTEWKYLRARLYWDRDHVEAASAAYLETSFVHECLHALLDEVTAQPDTDRSHEERVATELADAFMRLHDKVPRDG